MADIHHSVPLETTPPPVQPEQPSEPEQPEPEAPKSGNMRLIAIVLLIVGVGGAAYYFKIYRPKMQGQSSDDYSEADYIEVEEDDGPPWYEDDDTEEDSR